MCTRWTDEEVNTLLQMVARRQPVEKIAAALGRSPEAVRAKRDYARPTGPTRKRERPCMTCKTNFRSEGPHNRMCGRCRSQSVTRFEV
jgi:uncharacterized paraquat-inducible protein A